MIKANLYFDDMVRKYFVEEAMKLVGCSYEHEKIGPTLFDCSGLPRFLYEKLFGIDIFEGGIGRSTTGMAMTSIYGIKTYFKEKDPSKDISAIKPGDILFFHLQSFKFDSVLPCNKYPGHCGIYIGNNTFIHATSWNSINKVIISNFNDNNNRYYKRLVGFKDIVSYQNGGIFVRTKEKKMKN